MNWKGLFYDWGRFNVVLFSIAASAGDPQLKGREMPHCAALP